MPLRVCVNAWMKRWLHTWSRLEKKQINKQEITAASISLLASINEHEEKMGVATDNLSQEISKSKAYTDIKFSTVKKETQDIR
jgi:hypothetical protein